MASKKDLEARIEALEAEIALLKVKKQPGVFPGTVPSYPYWPHPNDWYPLYPKIWCSTSTAVKGTISINGNDAALELLSSDAPTS